MKLEQLTPHEHTILNGIHPELCATVIEEKNGKRAAEPDLGVAGALTILRKLDLEDLRIVEKSTQYGIDGDACEDENLAAECYRQAFEINPYNDLAMMSYGCLLAGMGQLEEGIKWVGKAALINPENKRARQNLVEMKADLCPATFSPSSDTEVLASWDENGALSGLLIDAKTINPRDRVYLKTLSDDVARIRNASSRPLTGTEIRNRLSKEGQDALSILKTSLLVNREGWDRVSPRDSDYFATVLFRSLESLPEKKGGCGPMFALTVLITGIAVLQYFLIVE